MLLLASWCNSTSSLFDGFLCFFVDDRLLEDDEEEDEEDDDDLLDEEEDLWKQCVNKNPSQESQKKSFKDYLVFFEICRMNSAALLSPFFEDFDLDFLCFFLRCDPDRLLDLERPRDDEDDEDELEEDDVDLGKKDVKDVIKCQALSTLFYKKTCFFCSKFFSQALLNCFVHFWILTLLPSPSSSFSSHWMSFSSFWTPCSYSCSGSFWASLPLPDP